MTEAESRLWQQVMSHWHQGHPASTLECVEVYIDEYPDNDLAYMVLGETLIDLARYDEAKTALEKAIKLCPKTRAGLAFARMGHLYVEKGNFSAAERWYVKAVKAKDRRPQFLIYAGNITAKRGKFTEAKRYYRRAIKSNEVCDEAYLNLGYVLRAEGKYEEALECFEKALEHAPKYILAKEAKRDMLELFDLRD